jgi:DNA repair ATPase RecN
LFQANAKLIAPSSPYEKTASAYRFAVAVAPRAEQNFAVKEEVTVSESFSLGTAKSSQLAEYSERGLPKKALDALKKAASLLSEAESIVEDINRAIQIRDDETASQERIRSNIVAAGRETEQGKEFLGKLSDSEKQIEQLESRIQALRKQHEKAQATYSDYVYRLAIS